MFGHVNHGLGNGHFGCGHFIDRQHLFFSFLLMLRKSNGRRNIVAVGKCRQSPHGQGQISFSNGFPAFKFLFSRLSAAGNASLQPGIFMVWLFHLHRVNDKRSPAQRRFGFDGHRHFLFINKTLVPGLKISLRAHLKDIEDVMVLGGDLHVVRIFGLITGKHNRTIARAPGRRARPLNQKPHACDGPRL